MSKTSPNFYDDVKALRREVRAMKASNTITTTLDRAFPVGAVYMTWANSNPGAWLGGTWEQMESETNTVYFWRRTA